MKYKIALFVLVLGLFVQCGLCSPKIDTVVLRQIAIEGESNLNSFVFQYYNTATSLPKLNIAKSTSDTIYKMSIPVGAFYSSNPKMTIDFYKMMKIEDFPYIDVSLDKGQLDKILKSRRNQIDASMFLSMAGTSKKVDFAYSLSKLEENKFFLNGFTIISLSGFQLSPPNYLFGLVKLKDCIIVKFDLLLYSETSKADYCEN